MKYPCRQEAVTGEKGMETKQKERKLVYWGRQRQRIRRQPRGWRYPSGKRKAEKADKKVQRPLQLYCQVEYQIDYDTLQGCICRSYYLLRFRDSQEVYRVRSELGDLACKFYAP